MCPSCGNESINCYIIMDLDGNYQGYCQDCYFENLGDLVENSLPPHRPIHGV